MKLYFSATGYNFRQFGVNVSIIYWLDLRNFYGFTKLNGHKMNKMKHNAKEIVISLNKSVCIDRSISDVACGHFCIVCASKIFYFNDNSMDDN